MAEKAAHFTATYEAKPSIFEIVAQNSLSVTFGPALKKLAQLLNTCSPRYFNWVTDFYEEAFLVFNGGLQLYFLIKHEASFSEYFYGLQRTSKTSSTFTYDHKKASFLFLVIFPYLRKKIYDIIQNFKLEEADGILKNDLEGNFKRMLVFLHSGFELTWSSWTLLNYLKYMSNATECQTPELKLADLKLIYARDVSEERSLWGILFQGRGIKEFSNNFIGNTLISLLEIGAFFTQFLQAWNAKKSSYDIKALPTTSPPLKNTKSESFKGKCPICLESWKIPSVLPVSGFIFCFACILRRLREEEKCPITNLPARPPDIIRLYL